MLNTGNSILNCNNSIFSNEKDEKYEGKFSNKKNNMKIVKEDNYKNCLLDKVHKKTAGKYMILDYNSNSDAKKDKLGPMQASIAKKI
jgi:hypothetical protein